MPAREYPSFPSPGNSVIDAGALVPVPPLCTPTLPVHILTPRGHCPAGSPQRSAWLRGDTDFGFGGILPWNLLKVLIKALGISESTHPGFSALRRQPRGSIFGSKRCWAGLETRGTGRAGSTLHPLAFYSDPQGPSLPCVHPPACHSLVFCHHRYPQLRRSEPGAPNF